MSIINITVKNKIAQNPTKEIVCGNNDYVIYFDFDEEWAEYSVKTARFTFNNSYIDVVFEGNKVNVPIITNTFTCAVGVFAGDLRTTTPAVIKCQKSILCEGGVPAAPTDDDFYKQVIERLDEALKIIGNATATTGKISTVTLPANQWEGTESPYSQVVNIAGATEHSKIDLNPTIEQLSVFHNKDITFVTGNKNGVITVYCIGQKPTNDYTIQVSMIEVERYE